MNQERERIRGDAVAVGAGRASHVFNAFESQASNDECETLSVSKEASQADYELVQTRMIPRNTARHQRSKQVHEQVLPLLVALAC